MSCPHAFDDGAYVLGALSPVERAAYEEHLAQCDECRASVARMAPLPGLLRRVDPDAIAEETSTPGRLPRLIAAVAGQRRRQARWRRWRVAGAAAAAALTAVIATVVVAGALEGGAPDSEQMEPVAASVVVSGWVGLTDTDAGTEVWLRCTYPRVDDPGYGDEPRVFRLIAVSDHGAHEQVGSWLAGPDDTVTVTGVTRFTSGELLRLELRDADDATLLTHEVD
jgi:hypothetical protein